MLSRCGFKGADFISGRFFGIISEHCDYTLGMVFLNEIITIKQEPGNILGIEAMFLLAIQFSHRLHENT